MTGDARRLATAALLAVSIGLLLQTAVPGLMVAERFLIFAVLPPLLGLVVGRFMPRFVLVGLAIALVIQAPEAGETELSPVLFAATAALAVGVGLGVGGTTASIAVVVAPVVVLWIGLQYDEPVSVPLLALTALVAVTGMVLVAHDRVAAPWPTVAEGWWRGVAAVAAVLPLIALAVLLVPQVEDDRAPSDADTDELRLDARPGDGDGTNPFSYAGFGDELDVSDPVELDDEVVFRVETDRTTFWRVATFAEFDGERWSSGPTVSDGLLPGLEQPPGRGPVPFQELAQTFTIERPLAGQVPTAWQPVAVSFWDTIGPVRPDGTVVLDRPLTSGERYVAFSATSLVSADGLRRAKGPVPAEILEVYADAPDTSSRVRETAEMVTAGASSDFDRIVALEQWIGRQVAYGRDIDPMPEGVDVVDHFLFESRVGFCEQIGTSLVVMARSLGLPARLVVGFVPEERDEAEGEWVVRGRNAHAWAEVWFPEVGWQAFDPTAQVPLSADDEIDDSPERDVLGPLLAGVAVLLALAVLVAAGRLAVSGLRSGVGGAANAPRERFVADRLVDLAGRAGVDVTPPRTILAIATDVDVRLDVDALTEVAALVDEAAFAGRPLGDTEQARCQAILDRVEARIDRQDEQDSMEQPALVRAHSGRRSAKRSRPG